MCSIKNKTETQIFVGCIYKEHLLSSGTFVLEVYDTSSEKLILSSNQKDDPSFILDQLTPNTSYVLVIYSVNEKTRSNNVVLTVTTDPVPFKQSEQSAG